MWLGEAPVWFQSSGGPLFFSLMPRTESYRFCPLLQTHGTMTVSFTEKDRGKNLPRAHWLGLLSPWCLKAPPVGSCLTPELLVEVRCLSHWVALAPPEIPGEFWARRQENWEGRPGALWPWKEASWNLLDYDRRRIWGMGWEEGLPHWAWGLRASATSRELQTRRRLLLIN